MLRYFQHARFFSLVERTKVTYTFDETTRIARVWYRTSEKWGPPIKLIGHTR